MATFEKNYGREKEREFMQRGNYMEIRTLYSISPEVDKKAEEDAKIGRIAHRVSERIAHRLGNIVREEVAKLREEWRMEAEGRSDSK